MKTGKLMKFKHPDGDVQAYLYRDAGVFRASLYVLDGTPRRREPVHTLADSDEDTLLAEVRAWVEAHYPRPR
jgi:hypothetical protein